MMSLVFVKQSIIKYYPRMHGNSFSNRCSTKKIFYYRLGNDMQPRQMDSIISFSIYHRSDPTICAEQLVSTRTDKKFLLPNFLPKLSRKIQINKI